MQHLPVQGGDAEPAVDGAFVVLAHREDRPSQRCRFLGLQDLALDPVGEVGGDDLEDPPAQDGELLGVVVGGETDQVLLGGLALLRRHREVTGGRAAGPAR